MQTSKKYDLIVIGFGKGGKTLADHVGAKGYQVAVIEKDETMYGGTCINVGCLPTKSLVHRAKVITTAVRFGIDQIDSQKYYRDAISEKDRMTAFLRNKNYHKLADKPNIDVIHGEGSFVDAKNVMITSKDGNSQIIEGRVIVINTGSHARTLNLPGFENNIHLHNSQSILELDKLPNHLGIIGAGYIGLEFSSYFRGFGAEVTVIQSNDNFLPKEDREDAKAVKERLEKLGVKFIFNANTENVETLEGRGNNNLRLNYSQIENGKKSSHALEISELLVAIGRVPATHSLHADKGGVELGTKGEIKVDEGLRTSQKHIFAVGDVKGGPQFTFVSLDDFRIVLPQVLAILEGKDHPKTSSEHNITLRPVFPNTTFIDPPYSRIGLSEDEAKKKYTNVIVKKMPAAGVPKAHVVEETVGFLKVIIDGDTDLVFEAVLFCHESHEMINLFTLAINEKITTSRLSQLIYNHPVMSEALNDLLE